eukprot:TRINITY_DN10622_c0_g1_i1.p1 TRINITY_DN10622_c0_g1~~TRINITY_DN10622_c0_g1_i1.p1  ORF type:complete len:221 (-),score=17.38 TRINITY_DN10622_c0_g1_i1:311-973(-)
MVMNPLNCSQYISDMWKLLMQAFRPSVMNIKNVTPPLPVVFPFFDRQRETASFSQLLQQTPKIIAVLGCPNSGKSNLINKVLNDNKHSVVYLNLRMAGFADSRGLYDLLYSKFTTIFTQVWDSTKVGFKFMGLEIGKKDDTQGNLNDFEKLLSLIEDQLRSVAVKPVFFIDEANELKVLFHNENGKAALHTLLKWLVVTLKKGEDFIASCLAVTHFSLNG